MTPRENYCNILQVIEMEKIVRQALLYDFYGELLTEHQKRIYVVLNDMSLSEIAEEQGISRQGVHDLIRRCDRLLSGYEEKLKLVDKFQKTRKMVGEIKELTKRFEETKDMALIGRIGQISQEIIEL